MSVHNYIPRAGFSRTPAICVHGSVQIQPVSRPTKKPEPSHASVPFDPPASKKTNAAADPRNVKAMATVTVR